MVRSRLQQLEEGRCRDKLRAEQRLQFAPVVLVRQVPRYVQGNARLPARSELRETVHRFGVPATGRFLLHGVMRRELGLRRRPALSRRLPIGSRLSNRTELRDLGNLRDLRVCRQHRCGHERPASTNGRCRRHLRSGQRLRYALELHYEQVPLPVPEHERMPDRGELREDGHEKWQTASVSEPRAAGTSGMHRRTTATALPAR